MIKANKAVFAIYNTRSSLENAIDKLKINGFRMCDISVLLPQDPGKQEYPLTLPTNPKNSSTNSSTGAVLGAIVGLLAGIDMLAILGIGPFLGAGPLVASLIGIGIVIILGAVSGALIGLGVPKYETKHFGDYGKDGGLLMSIHVDNSAEAEKAKKTLETTDARDISIIRE